MGAFNSLAWKFPAFANEVVRVWNLSMLSRTGHRFASYCMNCVPRDVYDLLNTLVQNTSLSFLSTPENQHRHSRKCVVYKKYKKLKSVFGFVESHFWSACLIRTKWFSCNSVCFECLKMFLNNAFLLWKWNLHQSNKYRDFHSLLNSYLRLK